MTGRTFLVGAATRGCAVLAVAGLLSAWGCGASSSKPADPPRTLVVFAGGETLAVDTTSGAARHLNGPLKDVFYVPSPDGTKLVLGCRDDGTAYISAVDTSLCMYDESGYKQLTHSRDLVRPGLVEDDGTTIEASWSADSRKLAFLVRELADPGVYSSGDIYVADLGANTVKRIAEGAFAEIRGPMAWSPDGSRIALRNSSRLALGDRLLVIEAATGQSVSYGGDLPAGGVEQYAWSPDSSAVAFVFNDRGGELYVAGMAGGALSDLGPAWGGTAPAWSPDGAWIAAVFVGDGVTHVFITRIDGSDRRVVGGELVRGDSPAWAPDSKRLAFAGSTSGGFNDRHLFVTDTAGAKPRELATGTTLAFFPLIAFSDDGQRLLFTGDAPPCMEGCPPGYLFMVDVKDGSAAVRLHDEVVGQFLGWAP